MPEIKEIELRSEEVQDILTRVPHWMIRWGNVLVLALLLMVFVGSWLIQYPDIIKTDIVITTATPPEKLITRSAGRIEKIFVQDQAIIPKGTALCVIENSANYNDVFLLKSIIDTIHLEQSEFPFDLLKMSQLGDVENTYSVFQKEYVSEQLNKKLQPYKVESTAQSLENIQLRERLNLLISQKEINEGELQLQKKELDRYETLFSKGIISAQEIEKQRLQYLQAQKNYKSLLSSISQLKSSLNELNRSKKSTLISEDKENVILERNVLQSFFQLKKAVKDWELNYVLRSSITGKLSYLQIWKENQTVTSGENVFSVIPVSVNNYLGKVKAVAQNSGKLKIGQDVNIRLANFPDREYGILKGKVKSISLTPDKDGNLLLDISLPNGLQTSYNKKLKFQQEMPGTAEIVTEDLRLLERILYQFRDIFKR
jgi:multidrug efflux pump subunit AcrA (membrane-fusion protein)